MISGLEWVEWNGQGRYVTGRMAAQIRAATGAPPQPDDVLWRKPFDAPDDKPPAKPASDANKVGRYGGIVTKKPTDD